MWAKLTNFLREVRVEFSKVSWPTREELVSSTGVVLAFSAIFAVCFFLFDLAISSVWKLVIGF